MVGWEWRAAQLANGVRYEYPEIFSFVVVPAEELATERDKSVTLRGGRVEPTGLMVPSKKDPGQLTRDKGNAGKLLRIVHQSRRSEAFELSKHIQSYLQFCDVVGTRLAMAKGKTLQKTARRPGRRGKVSRD